MEYLVRFDGLSVVTVKNAVFWDVRHVALVRTDISEKRIAFIISVKRISELGPALVITSN
jgi:hypothetical protein